ncbi:MAG: hypothetical protein NBV76_05315 [Candidatus Ochrobactrum gambitense]|nr:MAG: hypothetical protein NBV76_05315 [Candidatus Ochrobactrum gambitense]WEK17209.1 MAG: hypothetical protein P0Y54_05645 [Candidatus Ochrobactrum gambitense]
MLTPVKWLRANYWIVVDDSKIDIKYHVLIVERNKPDNPVFSAVAFGWRLFRVRGSDTERGFPALPDMGTSSPAFTPDDALNSVETLRCRVEPSKPGNN